MNIIIIGYTLKKGFSSFKKLIEKDLMLPEYSNLYINNKNYISSFLNNKKKLYTCLHFKWGEIQFLILLDTQYMSLNDYS